MLPGHTWQVALKARTRREEEDTETGKSPAEEKGTDQGEKDTERVHGAAFSQLYLEWKPCSYEFHMMKLISVALHVVAISCR